MFSSAIELGAFSSFMYISTPMILEESNNIFNDSGASLVGICTPLNHEFEPSARGPVYASFKINPSKNITIGNHVRIGAGSVVVNDVPDNCTVVGIPGRIVKQKLEDENGTLMHNRIPDPITCELNRLKYELLDLKNKIEGKNE